MESMFNAENAWLAQRLGKFTASQVGRLMTSGKAKGDLFSADGYAYINEVIAEITTGEAPENGTFKQYEWGHANEFEAIQALEIAIKTSIGYYGGWNPKYFPFNAFSGGSPDGLTEPDVIEVKCPFKSAIFMAALIASRGAEPTEWLKKNHPKYFAQLHLNMLSTKRTSGIIAFYDPRQLEPSNRLAIFYIKLDTAYAAEMEYRLSEAGKIVKNALAMLTPTHSIIQS